MKSSKKERINRIKTLYERVSPLIEEYTCRVCPDCDYICCRARHYRYDEYDRVFLEGLGAWRTLEDPSGGSASDGEDSLCPMLSAQGCRLKRWQRPFRCTWFFCDALLTEMDRISAYSEEHVFGIIREIQYLRGSLLEDGG